MEAETFKNFSNRDMQLWVKKRALQEHLIKTAARKEEYKVIKGVCSKDESASANISLKYFSKDLEAMAVHSVATGEDIGSQSIGVSYELVKISLVSSARLTAVNEKIFNKSVRVVGNTVQFGKSVYRVGNDLYKAAYHGTISGTINIYKNMIINKAATKIRYSSPLYHVLNVRDNIKTMQLKTEYGITKTIKLVKGIKTGTVKITKKDVRETVEKATFSTKERIHRLVKGASNVTNSRILRSTLRGGRNFVKGITIQSGDADIGTKGSGLAIDSARYSYVVASAAGRATVATTRNAYRTGRGTIRFAQNIKSFGIKKTSNLWYQAHLKGAGKKLRDKLTEKFISVIKKALFNPIIIGIIALFFCSAVIVNTAVVTASSVVGGVIENLEELAEGLQEVWENVTAAIEDFIDKCVSWLCALFGFNDDSNDVDVGVDIDIGDSLSICEYLLGTVQLYKAEYSLKIEERYKELIEEQGYHGVIFYNLLGEDIEIHDINDPDKGLVSDKKYVQALLPVWKAVILGTIGSDFTGQDANDVAKDCFDEITEKIEIPYVDINEDGIADYSYCDGSCSVNEGENKVYTHVGGVIQEGIVSSDTGICYNNSGVLYHSNHNTDGLACCMTTYTCGSHIYYSCDGHNIVEYCSDTLSCSNIISNTSFCGGGTSCNNRKTVAVGNSVRYVCGGHLVYVCGGHEKINYCWDGWNENYENCDNYVIHSHFCYLGHRKESNPTCSTEKTFFTCKGYNLCYGHKLMKFYIGSHGFERLINRKFLIIITALEYKRETEGLTMGEKETLDRYKMYYEYALGCDKVSDPIAEEFFANLPD